MLHGFHLFVDVVDGGEVLIQPRPWRRLQIAPLRAPSPTGQPVGREVPEHVSEEVSNRSIQVF
jgi:hypothetical protein